jgi:hypothetical protein
VTTQALNGLFRGICVDNKDPRNLGRIRVQVPQILGTSTSGWAFPAWSIHETSVWPQDRLPVAGDGVWVMFDSTSPDKMIWIAAFGALDLINQPGFTPDIEFTSTIDIALTGEPEWNEQAVFFGTLGSDGGVPNPSPEVAVEMSTDGGTTWTEVGRTPVVDPNTGVWSVTHRITTPGVVDYRANFPGVGVYSPAVSTSLPTDTATETTTSTPIIPATLWNGTGFAATGTVKTLAGDPVTDGTVDLWWRNTIGPDTSWKKSVSESPVSSGTYSIVNPPPDTLGATEWQVKYSGPGYFLPSDSGVVARTVNLRPASSLTKGAVTHTSASFTWAAVPGATHFNVEYKINEGVWTALGGGSNLPALGINVTGLLPDFAFSFRVQTTAQDPTGTWVLGGWSTAIGMITGHPQQTEVGATDWVSLSVQYYDSHRNDSNAWGSVSDMRQGYYSSPYGGEGYIGVARYTGTRVRDAIIAACGSSARHANGTCSAAEIWMTRKTGVGDGAGVILSFYTTTSDGTGSRPVRDGTKKDTGSTGTGASAWADIGTEHGQRIGDAGANSICIYRNDKTNYGAWDPGDLRLKWSWDYISVEYLAPAWT